MDGSQISKVLPREVVPADLTYTHSAGRRLVLTDGRGFQLDIHEFSSRR